MQSVEITILSAENLRVGKKPVTRSTFVTVRTGSDPDQCCSTKMSADGGSNPTWTDKLELELPALHAGFVTLEVHRQTSSGSKLVGGARVPVADFLGSFVPINHLQLLSYRLRDSTGERNGIINISVRVKSPEQSRCSQAQQSKAVGVQVGEEKRYLGGVVTGVPAVWLGRPRHY